MYIYAAKTIYISYDSLRFQYDIQLFEFLCELICVSLQSIQVTLPNFEGYVGRGVLKTSFNCGTCKFWMFALLGFFRSLVFWIPEGFISTGGSWNSIELTVFTQ